MASQPVSWAERCSASKTWSPRALSYFTPVVKDGRKVAICLPEEVAQAAAIWEKVLMGYFVGLKPYVPALAGYFKKVWMIKGTLQVLPQGNGFLLFKFSDDEDKCQALEDGLWFVQGKPLVLQQWTIDSLFEKDKLSTIPLWVKFPKLSLRFWSPNLIGRAASTLGVPLYMDEATATGSHVCIEIEASFSFPRYTHLEVDGLEEEIAVAYDWEPKPCQACSSFGHEQGTCICSTSILTNSVESSPAPPTPECLVVGEAVAVGTSTPLDDTVAKQPANRCTEDVDNAEEQRRMVDKGMRLNHCYSIEPGY